MKTAKSIIKIYPKVINPKTGRPYRTVMWPPTNQVRQIPVLQNFRDKSLENMLYWIYDETTATAIIKLPNGSFRLDNKNDLLQFGKWDIHHLSLHQIKVAEEIFEHAAKEYTSMVAKIIQKGMWSGSMEGTDVMLFDED